MSAVQKITDWLRANVTHSSAMQIPEYLLPHPCCRVPQALHQMPCRRYTHRPATARRKPRRLLERFAS
jgi:hypothetical protein